MPPYVRDRIAGTALLAVAVVWVGLVYATIPPGEGTLVGPRAFPLYLGIALGALSLLLLRQGFSRVRAAGDEGGQPAMPNEAFSVAASVAAIVVYAVLLEPLGFMPATALIVMALMVVVLGIRNPVMVGAMSIGLALGCFLVFGKLLGTYLPPGRLITVYF